MRARRSYYPVYLWLTAIGFMIQASTTLADKPIRMAVLRSQEPVPPFVWFDSCKQQASGVMPKLLQRLISDAGYHLQPVFDSQNINLREQELQTLRFESLLNEELDLFFSTKAYADNNKVIIGKEPLMTLNLVLLVPPQLKDQQDIAALMNYTGAFSGVRNGQQHRAYQQAGFNVLPANSLDQQLLWLTQKKIDFAILEKRVAKYVLRKYQLGKTYYISPISLQSSQVYLYAKKGTPFEQFVVNSDERLRFYKRSGLMENLIYHQLTYWFELDKNCLKRTNPL